MEEIIVGSVSVIVGLAMVIYNRPLSRAQIRSQNQFWGFNFGEKAIAASRSVILIVGVGFISFGLLALFHITRFK